MTKRTIKQTILIDGVLVTAEYVKPDNRPAVIPQTTLSKNKITLFQGVNKNNLIVRLIQEENIWYESVSHSWGWGFWKKCINQNDPKSELSKVTETLVDKIPMY